MDIASRLRNGLRSIALRTRVEAEATTRAFLCSDVVSFSRLTDEIGDRRTLELMRGVARLVRAQSAAHGGRELEVRGDCFLLAFTSPLEALCCGVAIHRALAADRHAPPREQIALRSAIHAGCVVRDGERYFGRNLILAFRLLERAGRGEILVSSQVKDLVAQHWRGRFSAEHGFQPKGLREALGFVSVDWLDPATGLRDVARRASKGAVASPRSLREASRIDWTGTRREAGAVSDLAAV